MEKQFEVLRNTRKSLIQFIEELSPEQLNKIPPGFNNNIIWNLAHMISAQQNVCYVRSGRKVVVDEAFFAAYKPDTKPEGTVGPEGIAAIKGLLFSTIDRFESDYKENVFSDYVPWTNRYGVEIATIEDVLGFLPYHEGLHLGYIMALKRLITNSQR